MTQTIAKDVAGPESQGVMPVLVEGTRVQVIAGEYSGRMAYITDITFATPEDEARFHNPHGSKRNTAAVDTYTVKTRDGRTDTFTVKPSEIRVLDETNGWGRGSI
jgi:hypothetical protein